MSSDLFLVVSVAVSYNYNAYQIFVGSLRAHYNGDIKLLTQANTSALIRVYCKQHNVVLYSDVGVNTSDFNHLTHGRFSFYEMACKNYTYCFACDFRDVFFQTHPFKLFTALFPDLVVSMEGAMNSRRKNIGTSLINSNWIRTCYDETTASAVSSYPILNSGAIFGTPRGFQALAVVYKKAAMNKLVERWKFFRNWVFCADQAILNVAVHTRQPEVMSRLSIVYQPCGNGTVHTMYTYRNFKHGIPISSTGVVLNDDGTASPIVHMWDRLPHHLQSLCLKRLLFIRCRKVIFRN